MICPICHGNDTSSPFKKWNYAGYNVERHVCSECEDKYNVYFKEDKIAYTVPK